MLGSLRLPVASCCEPHRRRPCPPQAGGRAPDRPALNILATSAGFQPDGRYGLQVGPVVRHAIALSEASRPRLCLMHTATGDDAARYALTYAALARDCPQVQVSHLQLFPMPNVADPRAHLLSQDVVWVGGGSVVNLLAVWRAHGLAEVFREAWEQGVVLAGGSAGSLCWHVGGTTDSFGPDLRPVTDGLALLPFSNCPHYDSEGQRRPLYRELVGSGALPAGWASDDGVGLHFRGAQFAGAVSDRADAYAWRVDSAADGALRETRVEPRRLDEG